MDDREILKVLCDALSPVRSSEDEDPPPQVLDAAYAAGDWLLMDDRLAELVLDSADSLVTPGVRGSPGETRQLTYRLDDLTIECELAPDALLGQVVPVAGVAVELVGPEGPSRAVDQDADGRFLVRPRPRGPVGIRCTRPDRPRVMTPWLLA
jgi:hypothetical protein